MQEIPSYQGGGFTAVRTITTRLALDGEAQFKEAMAGVNASLRAIRSEIALSEAQFKGQANTIEALTIKQRQLAELLGGQSAKVKALAQAVVDANAAYGEGSKRVAELTTQLNRARADIINTKKALQETQEYLKEARDSADGTAKSIDGFGNATKKAEDSVTTLAGALQSAGVAYAIKEIADAIHACVDASMEFETAMANFNKVAKLSDSELAVMKEQIKQLSTEMPATTGEIAQVAEVSSRLGISKEYVLEFSRVMLDLGNVSDLTSEQAATALARFANITGTAAEDYERLGSVIVALGNNFATSESEITNMASRLAAAGELANLSEADIMGLAAAMSSVGIEAEAGGTAMTQTLTAIEKAVTSGRDNLDKFAEIAGMSVEAFSAAWKDDPITAVQAFISGLGELDKRGESATAVLDELGMSGIRQGNMLKSLALASETLTGTLETANRAWAENTELAATAAAKYDTTEAKVAMAANAANNLKIAVGDQLTPALGLLADAGTGAFSFAAGFVEETPLLVSAITGVVAAAGVMAAGFTVLAAKAALAAIATSSLGAALTATPIGGIALAIGGLVAAFTAVASAADEAEKSTTAATQAVEESRAAFEQQAAAAAARRSDVESLVAQLEELATTEDRTAGEKERLVAITEELNAAVPGLGLEYDRLTDSLNLTTDQMKELAAAQMDAQERQQAAAGVVRAERDQAQVTRELAEAQNELEAATRRLDDARAAGSARVRSGNSEFQQLRRDVEAAETTVAELEEALDTSRQTVADMEAALEELAGGTQEAGDGLEEAAGEAQKAEASYEELNAATQEAEGAVLSLSKASDILSKALKEQSEEGSLSCKTTMDLIEAGYGAALAIDEESGAVTLNREEYIRLAGAKIQEQIATLESARANLDSVKAFNEASEAAAGTGSAYWDAAKGALALKAAEDSKPVDLQIAALKRAMDSLNSYGSTVTSAVRRSSGASKKIKTQAEKDLEAYKQLKAALDHEKNMDLVDEADYYRKMAGLRDAYLTDDANVNEYRKVTEQIYKYDKSLAEKEADLWEEQSGKLLDELEKRVDGVTKEQERMENRLSGYGDLFDTEDDRLTLNSLQDQIAAIEAYGDALDRLRERGVSSSLMDEVMGMDVDSATQYANQLLAMGGEQWEQYNSLWEEKQETAARIAEEFFRDQMDALENEYNDKLGAALDTLTDTSFGAGVDTGQRLIDGLASMESDLYGQAQTMADRVSEILAGAGRIPSNSELAASFSPDRIRERFYGVTPQQMQDVGTGMVNAINTGGGGAVYPAVDVTLELDGQTLARQQVDPMRQAFRERPETLDDK